MKILLIGKNGQVGWELQRSLAPLGEVIALDRIQCDLSLPETIPEIIQNVKPDIIVNAAAYTAVDKAEKEIELAEKINAESPRIIAEEARKINALMVHYSTDYVFNGEKSSAYNEGDAVDPINIYGATKLKGEQAIQKSGVNYLIFRTSWVYASRGQNFVHSILRLAKQKKELNIVGDQIGSPTWARLIAEVTLVALIKSRCDLGSGYFRSNVYNLTSSGSTSWYGFAMKVIEIARKNIQRDDFIVQDICSISASDYPTLAIRPINSCLNVHKLQEELDIQMPSWETSIELCLRDML